MEDMKIRAGAKLSFKVDRASETAVSATFIAFDGTNTITDTVSFDSEGVAWFTFNSPDTDIVGEYEYQINENFATGSPDKYPNSDCDGCELPKLRICKSLEE